MFAIGTLDTHVNHKAFIEMNKTHDHRKIRWMGDVRTDANDANRVVSPEHLANCILQWINNQYSQELIRLSSLIMNFCLDLAVSSHSHFLSSLWSSIFSFSKFIEQSPFQKIPIVYLVVCLLDSRLVQTYWIMHKCFNI